MTLFRSWWRLLRELFRTCSHEEMIRIRREDGGLDVECSKCGYTTVLIAPADVVRMRRPTR